MDDSNFITIAGIKVDGLLYRLAVRKVDPASFTAGPDYVQLEPKVYVTKADPQT